MAAAAARKAHVRQEFDDIIEQQSSAIEPCNKAMPSTSGKRGLPLEVIDIDRSSKSPKNLVQSQAITTNPDNEGVATPCVHFTYFVLINGLLPPLCELSKIKLFIEGAEHLHNCFNSPSRNLVAGPLLDTNFTVIINKINSQLMKESEVFVLAIFGGGSTTLWTPFVNMLAAGTNNEAGLIAIADYTKHVAKGSKKDSECIAKFFVPHMERLDPGKPA